MYKQASQLKLRFSTNVGMLSVEQLWDLSILQIASLIRTIKKVLKKNDDDELSFLEESKVIDVENELRFNILKDIYLTKKQQEESSRTEYERKLYNQKIDALIADKKDENLKSLSIEELEKLRQQ